MKSQDLKHHSTNKKQTANQSLFSAGFSSITFIEAYSQWIVHLCNTPKTQAKFIEKSLNNMMLLSSCAGKSVIEQDEETSVSKPLGQNKRSSDKAQQKSPVSFTFASFLSDEDWWHNSAAGMLGANPMHKNFMEFATFKMLELFSAPNYGTTNLQELERNQVVAREKTPNALKKFSDDWQKKSSDKNPEGREVYTVGEVTVKNVGEVVYSNRLIELVQYQAKTKNVHPEPILIVPAWIMKYYVLDLSAQNELVKYLTEQGFTVFMVWWKGPDKNEFDLNLKDIRQLGVMSAIDTITNIMGKVKIHGMGYCLGGTLLSIAAATMARDKDERLKTLSLLVTQVDFTEAGSLHLRRIDDLDTTSKANSDLIGKRTLSSDLMAWDYDPNLMPFKLHNNYLHQLFLHNDFAEGRYLVDDLPISIADIQAPAFVVGTETDLVAPWRSVYKINTLSDTDMTFLLIGGGHNANIEYEYDHSHRSYKMATSQKGDKDLNPESWIRKHKSRQGSWWPELSKWLKTHSGEMIAAPLIGLSEKKPKSISKDVKQ